MKTEKKITEDPKNNKKWENLKSRVNEFRKTLGECNVNLCKVIKTKIENVTNDLTSDVMTSKKIKKYGSLIPVKFEKANGRFCTSCCRGIKQILPCVFEKVVAKLEYQATFGNVINIEIMKREKKWVWKEECGNMGSLALNVPKNSIIHFTMHGSTDYFLRTKRTSHLPELNARQWPHLAADTRVYTYKSPTEAKKISVEIWKRGGTNWLRQKKSIRKKSMFTLNVSESL